MGKGDRKTAKGKRFNASYGNVRPKVVLKIAGAAGAVAAVKKPATAKSVGKKVVRKTAA